jgi:hypothetical protein
MLPSRRTGLPKRRTSMVVVVPIRILPMLAPITIVDEGPDDAVAAPALVHAATAVTRVSTAVRVVSIGVIIQSIRGLVKSRR